MKRLRLNAADSSLLALDRFMDDRGRIGRNLVHLVVELDGAITIADLERGLGRLLQATPWPAATLRHGFPLFPPYWTASNPVHPRVREFEVDAGDRSAVDRHLQARLDDPIDPRREAPIRFDVLRASETSRTTLVLTWFHPLMDPRGAENLIGYLDRLAAEEVNVVWPEGVPDLAAPPLSTPWRDRLQQARSGKQYLDSFRETPPPTPTGAEPGAKACFRLTRFVAPDSPDRRHAEMTWRLAVVGRALGRVFRDRLGDAPFVLPISVDLRKKGDAGPVFGNHLSLHFTRFTPTEDPADTVRALRMEMIEAMKEGRHEATMAAIHLIRGLPVSLLAKRMASSTRGALASFHFADTGDYRGARPTFLGATVVNGYHIPTVTPRPGLGLFLNRHGDHENLVVSWRDGAVSADEVEALIADVGESLEWKRCPE
ncbi:MAG: hypothetical protein AAF488_00385 [Planctomycetota bacterium]